MLFAASAWLISSCTLMVKSETRSNCINDNWQFFRVDSIVTPSDSVQYAQGKFAESENVKLPHTPRLEPEVVNDQWQGICYYSKDITLTTNDLQQHLFLRFDAAMNEATIYINGKIAKQHLGGYLPIILKINDFVHEGENKIVVCLDNNDNATTGPKPLKRLDFNTYGGIYRSAWLEKFNAVHITDANFEASGEAGIQFRTIAIDGNVALNEVNTNVKNESAEDVVVTVLSALVPAQGKSAVQLSSTDTIKANKSVTYKQNLDLKYPKLWSPNSPNLYSLQTSVFVNGRLVDFRETKVGIRTIEISVNALKINGKETFLRGVNRHQEYPYIGYALSDEAQWRDARLIKEAGFDYVRCSHYPPSPAFLDACDNLGILVLDAILGWQYFGDEKFEAQSLSDSHQLLRRDRNHACILAWELSINESWMPSSFTSKVAAIRDEEAPASYTAGWVKDSTVLHRKIHCVLLFRIHLSGQ